MRADLRAAALGVFAGCSDAAELTEAERPGWSTLGCSRSRSRRRGHRIQRRDRRPGRPELPTRLAKALAVLLAGMDAIGVHRDQALGRSAIPRSDAFLRSGSRSSSFLREPQGTRDYARRCPGTAPADEDGSPRSPGAGPTRAGRPQVAGRGPPDRWALTDWALTRLDDAYRSTCSGFSTKGPEPSVGNPDDVPPDDTCTDATPEQEALFERLSGSEGGS